MSLKSDGHAVSRRKALKAAVAALCSETGFGQAENAALETLTEMLQSFLTELGRSSRGYTELSGRTESMLSDVVMALIEMGVNTESIPAYAKRPNKTVFIPPPLSTAAPNPRTLQTAEKKPHPSHIPDYLPVFPDPHTYIKTLTHKEPLNEYQYVREKAASQKRDVERALTRFIAKTGETQSLFKDDVNAYPLIAVKPVALPYLNALLPKDQDLDAQEPVDLEEPVTKGPKESSIQGLETRTLQDSQNGGSDLQLSQTLPAQDSVDSDAIDNPYLRPVRMPKKRKR